MADRRFAGVLCALMTLPAVLGGCATIEGAPRRVIDADQSVALLSEYAMTTAIREFHSTKTDARHGMGREQYRDMVVALYVNAIDARYYDFRSRISGERRELDSGIDIAVLTLTNAITAAATHHARDLAAIASTFGGAGAALNRDLFFDRALPALLSAMDTGRLRILARIQQNLGRNAAQYPLATAFADLSAYEMAGSLDRALEEVNAQVSQARQEAQAAYDSAVHVCISTEDVSDNRGAISDWIAASTTAITDIQRLGAFMGVTVTDPANRDQWNTAIGTKIRTDYCTNQELDTLRSAFNIPEGT